MKFLRYGLLAVAIIGLGMSLGYIVFQPADTHDHGQDGAESETVAATLVLDKPSGGTLAFADLEGDVLILDFWATWCAPCISEIPHYNELHAEYDGKGVHLIGVTLESGSAEDVAAFAQDPAHLIHYPLVMGNDEIVDTYGPIWGFPTTVLVGPDGKVVKTWIGPGAGKTDQIRELVNELLAGSTEAK